MVKRGFLLAASVYPEYVLSANYAAGTIKDYYPDAHITIFVPEKFRGLVDEDVFDIIISDNVPDHKRTKLYALSRSPYTELTVYVDGDMDCRHEDVQNIWDEIPADVDILITKIRPYNGKEVKWPGGQTIPQGEMIHHGGFFMYRTNERVQKFMEKWWTDYFWIKNNPWPYDERECRQSFGQWDQFIFWTLLNVDQLPVKVDFFEDDARWNFVNGYYPSETSSPIIFYHNTIKLIRNK